MATQAFYAGVDAVVLGRKTYQQVLSFGAYPYADKPGWVFSRNPACAVHSTHCHLATGDFSAQLRRIKQHAKQVWLVGGAELAASALAAGLLDQVVLTLIPLTLGEGLPWLGSSQLDTAWVLQEHYAAAGGVVQLVYRRREG